MTTDWTYFEFDGAYFRRAPVSGGAGVEDVWTEDGWETYAGDRLAAALFGAEIDEADLPEGVASEEIAMQPDPDHPASRAFWTTVLGTVGRMPYQTQQAMLDRCVRVLVGKTMDDIAGAPQAHDSGGWSTLAEYVPEFLTLYVGEMVRSPVGLHMIDHPICVIAHELFHFIDQGDGGEYGKYSHTPEFNQAYDRDIKTIPDVVRNSPALAYYCKSIDGSNPVEEVFAELGGLIIESDDPLRVAARFRECATYVANLVTDLAKVHDE